MKVQDDVLYEPATEESMDIFNEEAYKCSGTWKDGTSFQVSASESEIILKQFGTKDGMQHEFGYAQSIDGSYGLVALVRP